MILTCLVTHDRKVYTRRCIDSYLATRRPGDELVIVDNASTEPGMRTYLRSLSFVTLILNDENRYPGAACNQGWDAGLRWFDSSASARPIPRFLHRSDNDIEYLPGWGDEVERQFALNPDVSLLGILNLHEDRGFEPTGDGIEQVEGVGGNVVMPTTLFVEGLRWDERGWAPGIAEDYMMSYAARAKGPVARLVRTVANNMAFCRYADFPDYYNRTAQVRGLPHPERTV